MKRLIVLVVVTLLLCVPVQAKSLRAWIWGDEGVVGARLGQLVTENNEVGLSISVWPGDSNRGVDVESVGIYGMRHFAPIEMRNPLMLDFLPETIEGRPYFGGKFDLNCKGGGNPVMVIAGIIFEDILFLEYHFPSFSFDSTSMSSKILIGIRIKF